MKVCIIQPVLKNYRVPFFQTLQRALERDGIDLVVVYSDPWRSEAKRGDHSELPEPLGCRANAFFFGNLYIQFVLRPWLDADLVIVEQANKHALNYILLLRRLFTRKKVAFWGHGRSPFHSPNSLGERIKSLMLMRADWWFAYTRRTASYLEAQGFSRRSITNVENAVDVEALRQQLLSVSQADRQQVKRDLGWPTSSRVGIYCGSLYENKRLDLLFEAADALYQRDPHFRLLVVGGGPLEAAVRNYCAQRSWVRFVGPQFGFRKAALLSISEIWLNPGGVGLGVLDSFAAGVPLITSGSSSHGPELDYLENLRNSVVTVGGNEEYIQGAVQTYTDQELLTSLSAGALQSAERYSIENMAQNFAAGIAQCLGRS